jgi:hypothetical protein
MLAAVLLCLSPAYSMSYEAEQLQGPEQLTPFRSEPYLMRMDYGPEPSSHDRILQYFY